MGEECRGVEGVGSKRAKAINTHASRAVPHLSTEYAFCRLTSEFGWDPVRLAEYGR